MAKPNPLRILGIAPEALRGRTNEQISRLVAAMGRAIAQIEHPDVGGDEKRFKIFQGAIDELKDPEALEQAKQRLLKPYTTERVALEESVQRLTIAHAQARRRFASYVEAVADPRAATVFSLNDYHMRLLDVFASERRSAMKYLHDDSRLPFFELRLNSKALIEIKDGNVQEIPRRLVGTIKTMETGGVGPLLRIIAQCLTSKIVPTGRLSGRSDSIREARRAIPLAVAEPILSRLQPSLQRDSFLFSATKQAGIPSLFVEGKILEVTAIGQ